MKNFYIQVVQYVKALILLRSAATLLCVTRIEFFMLKVHLSIFENFMSPLSSHLLVRECCRLFFVWYRYAFFILAIFYHLFWPTYRVQFRYKKMFLIFFETIALIPSLWNFKNTPCMTWNVPPLIPDCLKIENIFNHSLNML